MNKNTCACGNCKCKNKLETKNFVSENPATGEKMPLNMPELYSPYGYVGVMSLMVLIVGAQLYVFYKKGWLGKF